MCRGTKYVHTCGHFWIVLRNPCNKEEVHLRTGELDMFSKTVRFAEPCLPCIFSSHQRKAHERLEALNLEIDAETACYRADPTDPNRERVMIATNALQNAKNDVARQRKELLKQAKR
ncbi:MAG: hypothetical protein M1826_005823 [Phylliscum demangeonii]|nr:MAG: hypothetical protein M1826_005823 [Phylliscum demangeonii]